MVSCPGTAAEWVVRLNDRQLSPNDEHALASWLVADERHYPDLVEAQTVWRLAGQLGTDPAARAYLLRDAAAPRDETRA